MIIVMSSGATEQQIEGVVNKIKEAGLDANISRGTERTVIGAIGDERKLEQEYFEALPGVEQAMHIVKPYKIVGREWHKQDSVIDIKGIPLGGNQIQIIAGPCSVETPEQMAVAAKEVHAAGCRLMRGGAFKPRTSPYAFQGHGVEGLQMFRTAAAKYNLPIVTELMDARQLETFMEYDVDVIQIGVLEEFGGPKLRPFLMGTLGATRFSADGYGADVNFSFGMSGGVKYYPFDWLALRVDLRGYGTITEASGAVFCSSGCVAVYSGSMIWQGELTGSIVISF